MNLDKIQARLCESFCNDIKILSRGQDLFLIETPFYFSDGDPYQIYLEPLKTGGFRLTDYGHTLMHLSYEHDIDKFKIGTRNTLLENIKNQLDISEDSGAFYIDSLADDLPNNLFKLGQALTQICDLTFLNKARVQKTFYEDLENMLYQTVDLHNIQKDFLIPDLPNASDYPIDYSLKSKIEDQYFFIFGIPNKDKAQLTTIIHERLLRTQGAQSFDSLLIFEDFYSLPQSTTKRLLNVGQEVVTSLSEEDTFRRKVLSKAA